MGADAEVLARAQLRVGTTLCGKYRIDRVLGTGAMGVVYAATHRMQRQFAVKMLHPELSLREDVRQRFLREGVAANSVKHPGAVSVTDNDVAEDGAAFLVMELLEGAEVQELFEMYGGRMPVERVLAIAHQLLDVLASAHVKAIVHRDIKPANLFVTHEGQLKVLDFGIARVRDAAASGAHATSTGMLLGTPAFMAPEQAYAKASEIDGQTDVWAVGATMFFLLSGQIVHDGENASQIMIQTATTPARSLAGTTARVPQTVVQLVDRALAFQKTERWSSAAVMRDATHDVYMALYGRPITREVLAVMWSETDETLATTHAALRATQAAAPSVPQAVAATRDSSLHAARPGTTLDEPPPHVERASGPGGTQPVTWAAAPVAARRFDLVGGTTSQPVSSAQGSMHAAGVPKRVPRAALALGVVLGVLTLGGAGALGLHAMVGARTEAAAAPTASSVPPAVAAALNPTTAPLPGVGSSPAPSSAVPSASAAMPVPHTVSIDQLRVAPVVRPTSLPPMTRSSSAPAVSSAPAPSCAIVVTGHDANGDPLFTKVCH